MRIRLTALAALTFFSVAVSGHDYQQGDLHIDHPWARPLPAVSRNGAAFFVLKNTGQSEDRLLSAQSDKAARVEIHNHIHEDGLMKMRKVEDVVLAAGETVTFGPGGLHIMFMGLTSPLKEGESFDLQLQFEKAGNVDVEVVIEQPGANHATAE